MTPRVPSNADDALILSDQAALHISSWSRTGTQLSHSGLCLWKPGLSDVGDRGQGPSLRVAAWWTGYSQTSLFTGDNFVY